MQIILGINNIRPRLLLVIFRVNEDDTQTVKVFISCNPLINCSLHSDAFFFIRKLIFIFYISEFGVLNYVYSQNRANMGVADYSRIYVVVVFIKIRLWQ